MSLLSCPRPFAIKSTCGWLWECANLYNIQSGVTRFQLACCWDRKLRVNGLKILLCTSDFRLRIRSKICQKLMIDRVVGFLHAQALQCFITSHADPGTCLSKVEQSIYTCTYVITARVFACRPDSVHVKCITIPSCKHCEIVRFRLGCSDIMKLMPGVLLHNTTSGLLLSIGVLADVLWCSIRGWIFVVFDGTAQRNLKPHQSLLMFVLVFMI